MGHVAALHPGYRLRLDVFICLDVHLWARLWMGHVVALHPGYYLRLDVFVCPDVHLWTRLWMRAAAALPVKVHKAIDEISGGTQR